MKMIRHQTVADDVCIREDVFAHFSEEKDVIVILIKNRNSIITLIKDMINEIDIKIHDSNLGILRIGHCLHAHWL